MRDASGIVFALGLLVVAAVLFVVLTGFLRRKQKIVGARSDELARQQREEQARLRKLVEAGTHVLMPDGAVAPKCYGCSEPATQKPYVWVRDDGLWDLVRRTFGAPARVRVGRDPFAGSVACEAHDPLLFQRFALRMASQQADRAKLESEHETQRARFQREGVYEEARGEIEKHQREIGGRRRRSEAPTRNVIPFVSSGRTGTDK